MNKTFIPDYNYQEQYKLSTSTNMLQQKFAGVENEIIENFKDDSSLQLVVSQLMTRINALEKVQTSLVVADTPESIASITNPTETTLVIKSDNALKSMTADKTFKSIAIVDAKTSDNVILKTNSLELNGVEVSGTKQGASNGKINFFAPTTTIKNVTVPSGSTIYNVFEGSQLTNDNTFATDNFILENCVVNNPELKHNVVNIYTFKDNAQVIIKDSYFNLNVATSNVMRASNYTNASGVTITFENVDWTYENKPYTSADAKYAAMFLFQAAGNDKSLTGDYSAISTWNIKFKNCSYNGEKITSANFGTIKQALYGYKLNNGGVSDITSIMNVTFE